MFLWCELGPVRAQFSKGQYHTTCVLFARIVLVISPTEGGKNVEACVKVEVESLKSLVGAMYLLQGQHLIPGLKLKK